MQKVSAQFPNYKENAIAIGIIRRACSDIDGIGIAEQPESPEEMAYWIVEALKEARLTAKCWQEAADKLCRRSGDGTDCIPCKIKSMAINLKELSNDK